MDMLKKLGLLTIILAPLDAFKFLSSYFSAYRFCVIVLVVLTIFHIIESGGKIILYKRFSSWTAFFIASCVVSFLISTNKELGKSFFFNDILGMTVILCFSYIYEKKDIDKLLLFYVRSQYVTIAFSLYAIILHFVFRRSIRSTISFLGFYFEMSDNQLDLLARSKSFLPNLFLPYSTTLYLEFSVGIAALICLYFAEKSTKQKKYFLVLAAMFSSLLLLSAQKGPIISFLLSLLIYMKGYQKRKGLAKSLIYILTVLFLGIIIIVTFGQNIFLYTIERFTEFGARIATQQDRHILLVYEAIGVWLQNFRSFIVGVGYSSASMRQGLYTWIPETFLCTYATLIAERGLLGIISILYYLRFYSSSKQNYTLFVIFAFVVISYLFYEMRYIHTSWMIVSIFSVNLIAQNNTVTGEELYEEINK